MKAKITLITIILLLSLGSKLLAQNSLSKQKAQTKTVLLINTHLTYPIGQKEN